ncbi:unnamed protein product [Oncorhynchus mykiss]|uniref:Uncharacterized protein n=1 Tax=Oncorhynchus mykiss TaxID=8022 RepID=A0A060ZFE2_ONCMY|nr:unnamed protein product [Oncorhynchus mykiss]
MNILVYYIYYIQPLTPPPSSSPPPLLLSPPSPPLSYQICEFLYEQNHLYDKILDCYLRDPLRKEEIFNYIHNLLSMPGYSSEEKHCVWEKALLHIAELVTLDPAKSADLVAMHFPEEVRPIITRLQVSL